MKSMDLGDNETEIEKLSQILSKIQNLYNKKNEQLEELQNEITELKEKLHNKLLQEVDLQSKETKRELHLL